MKKDVIILSLLFLIFSLNLVLAEEIQTANVEISNFQSTTNNFLSQEIIIPQDLQILTRAVFGLDSANNIELSVFIVLIASLVGIFITIKIIVNFIPIFDEEWISWMISIIITLLISTTGIIRKASIWLFGLGNLFEDQALLRLIVTIIILIIIIFGVTHLLKGLNEAKKKDSRRQTGFRVGAKV
ncbi:MAG: hypothetical protein AABX17_00225 [Nanoarchaeota archaeon]